MSILRISNKPREWKTPIGLNPELSELSALRKGIVLLSIAYGSVLVENWI